MKKNRIYLQIAAVFAVVAVGTFVGCNKGGPSSPTNDFPTGNNAPATTAATADVPAPAAAPTAADPCEGDASCGKGISAKFVGLDATITSTNTGHPTSGLVCYTKEFEGPNLPGTPVPWTVQANSASTVLFPIDAIAKELPWEKGQCEQTIKVQGDVFKGDACEGHIYAVAWPQDNPVTFINPDVGEWELVSEVPSEPVWGECEASDIQTIATEPSQCSRKGEYTITRTYKNPCNDETRTSVADMVVYEPCECPCEVEWIEQEPEITPYGDWGECVLSDREEEQPDLSFDEGVVENTSPQPPMCKGTQSRGVLTIIREMNSCTKEIRIKSESKDTEERGCETQCEGSCFYNVNSNLGSRLQQFTCENKTGGYPPANGEWGRWPDGPPSDHCRFTVPGIYSDPFRLFQLTPGQSHPRCNKF